MTLLPILRWLVATALWGAGGGLIIYLIVFGVTLDARGLLWFTSIGATYCAVMRGAQELVVFGVLEPRLPLRTRGDVLKRVVILGAVAAASFVVATWLIEVVTGFELYGNTGVLVISATIALGASIIGNGYFHLDHFYTRLVRAEEAALRAELGALRAQINPHFLFNSLNSIAALVRIDPVAAERVTESLAELFRYSLRSSTEPTVTLAEELASIDLYFAIERARFPERLATRVEVPEAILGARVPSLLLQPLVENAVKHGVARSTARVTVTIAAELRDGDIVLTVSDDGPGFATTNLDVILTRGHGLANVRERMRLALGDAASLRIAPHGVELRFPYRQEVRDAALHSRR